MEVSLKTLYSYTNNGAGKGSLTCFQLRGPTTINFTFDSLQSVLFTVKTSNIFIQNMIHQLCLICLQASRTAFMLSTNDHSDLRQLLQP